MITNVNYSNGDRNNIVSYLKNMKETNPDYQIIDVGGTYEGWSWSLLDAIVDINECKDKNIKQFQFNICDHDSWDELLEYVDKNGKFDFVIWQFQVNL
jgi:23S rRNA U2552 (ribose-2'-O)-methylase RlmE/FtsJ